jgi:hypothetical protein
VGRAFDDCGIAYFNRIRSFRDVIPAAAGIHVGSMQPNQKPGLAKFLI